MPTKNQLIRHGREEKRRTDSPQKGGKLPASYFFGIVVVVVVVVAVWTLSFSPSSGIFSDQQAVELILEGILGLSQSLFHIFLSFILQMVEAFSGGERSATLGGTEPEKNSPSRSEEETSKAAYVFLMQSQNSGKVGQEAHTSPPAGSSEGPEPDDDARKAVIERIGQNELFGAKLLRHFKQGAPMRALGPDAYHRDLSIRINQILRCEGKDGTSLRDLIDLKLNFEDPKKMNEILTRYFEKHKR